MLFIEIIGAEFQTHMYNIYFINSLNGF